ncbi:MAG: mycoredoxin [Candidatus Poriferisodalaceae bacterium]|jgi:mycoredoxin
MSTATAITYYWRPGCPFCMGLERSLEKLSIPMDRHNIWDDPKAAEFVRTHAGGNEVVPTVAVGDIVMVNPSPTEVLAAMAQNAPHLIPEGTQLPEPGKVGRMMNKLLGG